MTTSRMMYSNTVVRWRCNDNQIAQLWNEVVVGLVYDAHQVRMHPRSHRRWARRWSGGWLARWAAGASWTVSLVLRMSSVATTRVCCC